MPANPVQVSVRRYGAKGDGTTDDTAAIQAALNAAHAAGGGTIFIPRTANCYKLSYSGNPATVAGYHAITPALTVYDDTTIISDGATLKAPAWDGATNVAMFCDSGGGAARVTFLGVTFDGTGASAEAEHAGIWFGPATDLLVEHCRFLNWGGKGIQCLGSLPTETVPQRVRVLNNYFANRWGNPIACDAGISDIWIAGNYVTGANSTYPGEVVGINRATARVRIVDNVIDGWGSITVASGSDIQVRGNSLTAHTSAAGPGVNIGPSSDVRISDNTIDLSPADHDSVHAIALTGSGDYERVTVADNNITRMLTREQATIYIAPGSGTTTGVAVEGNTITGGPAGTDANACPIVVKSVAGGLRVDGNIVTSPYMESLFITAGTPKPVIVGNDFAGAIICASPDAVISNNRCASAQQAISHSDRSTVTGNRVVSSNSYDGTGAIATYGSHSIVANNVIENTAANMPWIYENEGGDYNKFGPNICIGTNGSVHVVGAHTTRT